MKELISNVLVNKTRAIMVWFSFRLSFLVNPNTNPRQYSAPHFKAAFCKRLKIFFCLTCLSFMLISRPAASRVVYLFGKPTLYPSTVPVGTVLTREFVDNRYICSTQPCIAKNVHLFPEGGLTIAKGPVIRTSVSGVSMQILINGHPITTGKHNITITQPVEVQLLRDERPAQFGNLSLTGKPYGYVFGSYFYLLGTLTPISGTCHVPDGFVTLPAVHRWKLTGVGSTENPTSFTLHFNNCPPGYHRVRYLLKPVGAPSKTPGLLPPSTGSTASGVAIQLTDLSEKPVEFNTIREIGAYNRATGGSYTVSLAARYMQTAPEVTPGQITGRAIILMDYQ